MKWNGICRRSPATGGSSFTARDLPRHQAPVWRDIWPSGDSRRRTCWGDLTPGSGRAGRWTTDETDFADERIAGRTACAATPFRPTGTRARHRAAGATIAVSIAVAEDVGDAARCHEPTREDRQR